MFLPFKLYVTVCVTSQCHELTIYNVNHNHNNNNCNKGNKYHIDGEDDDGKTWE